MPRDPQILADQLTLSQPRMADYAHQIILVPPDFRPSDGPVDDNICAYLLSIYLQFDEFCLSIEYIVAVLNSVKFTMVLGHSMSS